MRIRNFLTANSIGFIFKKHNRHFVYELIVKSKQNQKNKIEHVPISVS